MKSPLPRLIVITDVAVLGPAELVARLTELVARARPLTVAVLLRDPTLSARARLELGAELRAVTRRAEQQLWVADRLDLALLLDADGAHLGEASVSARAARTLLGPDRQLSRAWHETDVAAARAAELDGVSAVLLSPIFEARKGRPALGTSGLTALAGALQALRQPPGLYALGGVTSSQVAACDAAGARGIAAIGAALTGDIEALLGALQIRRAS